MGLLPAPQGEAIVTFDDGGQETVTVGVLVDPVIAAGGERLPAGKGAAK